MASETDKTSPRNPSMVGPHRPRIILPDAAHGYVLNVPKENVANVSVMDVDVVVTLTTGETLVLAEAGLGAMSNADMQISYSNGQVSMASLVSQSGYTTLPAHSELTAEVATAWDTVKNKSTETKSDNDPQDATHESGNGSGVSMNLDAVEIKIDKLLAKALQSQSSVSLVALPAPQKIDSAPITSSGSSTSKPNDNLSNFTNF